MSKAHIITSDVPLKEKQTLLGICGAEVKNARFALTWDTMDVTQPLILSTLLFCGKCTKKAVEQAMDTDLQVEAHKRYVYGIVEGQESTEAEAQQ